MFLALVICHLALVAASPFHKYPYVFLLDIGNEELEKTNTEQIKLSAPGGSIAIRYPAVGNGETIAHVRVSGIDFGTDLKANIVDGGPGYKYVVLVFMGNEGAPYDSVITIQTVSDEFLDGNQSGSVSNDYNSNKVTDNNDSAEISNDKSNEISNPDDENVSSEDTSDELDASNVNDVNQNKQVAQQSSNVYSYANSAADEDEDNDDNNDDDGDSSNEDSNIQSSNSNYEAESNSAVEDGENNRAEGSSEVEPSHFNGNYVNYNADNENEAINNVNSYKQYQPALPLRAYDGVRIYPQYSVPFALSNSDNSVYNPDYAVDSDHEVSDNDDRGASDKYKDSNNNYFEADDPSAVESRR